MDHLFKRKLIQILNLTALKVNNFEYHQMFKEQALATLKIIEKQCGKLDFKLKKRADEYALEILGNKQYSPWLYVYSALRKNFVEGWIPDNYYGFIVVPLINGKHSRLSAIKTMTNRILNSSAIPDSAYIIDGILYANNFIPIESEKARNTIFENNDIVFFKQNGSMRGQGVERLNKDSFEISKWLSKKDGCFQSLIDPHDFFKEITKNSTATIRITTIRDCLGRVSVRAAYLRVGRDLDIIVKSSTAIKIPIDLATGSLNEFGYMPDWSYSEKHPDSGFLYSGKQIPIFTEAKGLCHSLHESFPHFSCIGWDLCIDKNNEIKIMEWNAHHNDIKFSEATSGPCFSDLGWEKLWRISD